MKLGVNIDHVATIREARHTTYPDLLAAADAVVRGGADAITMHLREDRRHIQDADLLRIDEVRPYRINMEMALAEDIIAMALSIGPDDCCIVPERREELTTEGGLDVRGLGTRLQEACGYLGEAGIRVSLFVEPDVHQLEAILATGAPTIELHTGRYANATQSSEREHELARIREMTAAATEAGLQVNAGHGLDYENVGSIAAIPSVMELNIGHSIVARALFVGLETATREMKEAIRLARS